VLTVEADAFNTEARVAHDGAVPLASLVAAIGSVGVLATVGSDVASRRLPARTATPSSTRYRHLPNAAVVAILTVVLIETVFPVNSEKRWFLIMSLVLLWSIGLVARLAVTRRDD
jgi:protein-S-isoprenylcysteine O-methyltransferase Ste14